MKNFDAVINRQHEFMEDRPTLSSADADPLSVIKLLEAEIEEFKDAYNRELPMEEIAHEAADIAIFTITLFKVMGLDMTDEVERKIARNEEKYPARLFQSGDFSEATATAKKRWIKQGGDERFFSENTNRKK